MLRAHASQRCVCARACESCECARERRERWRNPTARPPNVCHYAHMYVGTSTCERTHMHVCVRARRERRRNPRMRPLVACHYVHIHVGMFEPICIRKRAYTECMSARMCVCVRACERASGTARTRATTRLTYICVCVSPYVYDAHTHTRIGGSICVWLQPYPRACAYGWIYMRACIDGPASTGVHRYACICVYIERYLYHYYTAIMYLYACIMYGPIAALWTQVPMSVCTQTDRCRWVHVCLAPSVQLNI
jgi:hypothetical protein